MQSTKYTVNRSMNNFSFTNQFFFFPKTVKNTKNLLLIDRRTDVCRHTIRHSTETERYDRFLDPEMQINAQHLTYLILLSR